MKTIKIILTTITLLLFTQNTIANSAINHEDLVIKMAEDEDVKNLLKHANQILFVNLFIDPSSLSTEIKAKYNQLTKKCEEEIKMVASKFPSFAQISTEDKIAILKLVSNKLPFQDPWTCASTARGATATCFEISSNFQTKKFMLCIAAAGLADLANIIATTIDFSSIHPELVAEVKACTTMFYSSDIATLLAMNTCASSWMDAVIGCFIAP